MDELHERIADTRPVDGEVTPIDADALVRRGRRQRRTVQSVTGVAGVLLVVVLAFGSGSLVAPPDPEIVDEPASGQGSSSPEDGDDGGATPSPTASEAPAVSYVLEADHHASPPVERPRLVLERLGSATEPRTLLEGGALGDHAWSPDGSQLVLSRGEPAREDLVVLDVSSGDTRRLTEADEAGDSQPIFSPDGERLAFIRSTLGGTTSEDLYVLDLQTTTVRQVTDTPELSESQPTWSPDGRRLAIRQSRSDPHGGGTGPDDDRIVTVAVDGTGQAQPVSSGMLHEQAPAWSPAGDWIVYVARSEDSAAGPLDAHLVRPDGTGHRRLVERRLRPGRVPAAPAWSPDGSRLALAVAAPESGTPQAETSPSTDLAVVTVPDGEQVARLDAGTVDAFPDWSKRGDRLVFNVMTGSEWGVAVGRSDGTQTTTLTTSDVLGGNVAFRPTDDA